MVVAFALVVVLGPSNDSAAATVARDRTVTDMPDDISGPQVHLLYVVASDGADRQLDTNGALSSSVALWQGWLRGQTGGRGMRLDTYRGELDITFLALGDVFRGPNTFAALRSAGFNDPSKVYAVILEGGAGWFTCGGAWPPFAVTLMRGTPPGTPCTTAVFPSGGAQPGYFEFGMLHEIVHVLGFVPSCAPHYTAMRGGLHVTDSRYDLMYLGLPEPWGIYEPGRMRLDEGHDDYFMAGVPGCPDFSNSPYLESLYPISVSVSGPGAVTSTPSGIDCPGSCAGKFVGSVTLTATPRTGAAFLGWTGACSGIAACVLTGEASVGASFAVTSHARTLTLRIRGQRATGALSVVDGYESCRTAAPVMLERRGTRGWSTVRSARTNGAGLFAVPIPKVRATYRARAPQTTAESARCLKALSRAVTSPG